MVEKKEEDNQQEEVKEPDSENIENEEEINDSQENTDSEETSEDENSEENNLEKEIETLKEEKIRLLAEMENLRKIKSRMQGWQLSTFEESYNHKVHQGISLFKKKLLEGDL